MDNPTGLHFATVQRAARTTRRNLAGYDPAVPERSGND